MLGTYVKYKVFVAFLLFLRHAYTGQMAEPIFTLNGSNDSGLVQRSAFGGHFATKNVKKNVKG
jgi:hypothetical protein